jgi:hypothetical protein
MTAKKITIEKNQLPPLSPDGKYLLRYRVISEDKNRNSHWSPIYSLDATRVWNGIEFENTIKAVTSSIEVTNTGITASWGDTNNRSQYDIFVSFGTLSGGIITYEPYSYHGSSPIHSYSFKKKDGAYTHVQAVIQLAGIEKVTSPTLTISQTSKSLQPTISGGGATG